MKLKKLMIIFLLMLLLFSFAGVVSAHDALNDCDGDIELNAFNVNQEDIFEEINAVENNDIDKEIIEDDGEDDIIYVDSKYDGGNSSGSEDHPYAELTDALRYSSQGKTIFIKNGNYSLERQMEFNNGFSIVGESANGVIIDSYVMYSFSNKFLFKFNLNNDCLNMVNLTFIGHQDSTGSSAQPFIIEGNGNFTMDKCNINEFNYRSTIDINVENSRITNSNFLNSKRVSYNQQGYHVLENVILPEVNVNNQDCVLIVNNVTSNNQVKSNGIVRISNSKFRDVQQNNIFYNNGGNLTLESSIVENCNVDYLLSESSNESISKLNYNIFINNNIKQDLINVKGDNDDFNYNWWDTISKPIENVDYWTVINVSYEKNKNIGIFNVEFKYSDGEKLYDLSRLNPEFEVLFKSSLSTLNDVISTNNGAISIEFTPKGDSYLNISYGSYLNQHLFGNIYVDINFNGEELGTIDNPFKTISKAIINAKEWETIFVENGVYAFDNVAIISKSINIIGQSPEGVILTGGQKGIFTTPTFMGNNIFIYLSNLNFINTSCDSTHTTLNLAQVFVESLVSNCIFENCSGQHGSLSMGGRSKIENCKFFNSKTTANDGGAGAIYFNGEGTLEIDKTIISNTENGAEYMNGVIYADNANGKLHINECSILNTTGVVLGIINSKCSVSITNSRIYKNSLTHSEYYINSIFRTEENGGIVVEESVISQNNADYIIHAADQNSNITLNYNSIINNSCQFVLGEGYHNFNSNWWGTNDRSNDFVENWVVMNPSFRTNFGSLYINVYFNRCFDGLNYHDLDKNLDFIDYEYNLSNETEIYHYPQYDYLYFENINWIDVISGNAKIRYAVQPDKVYVDCNYGGIELGTQDSPFKSIRSAINNITSIGEIHVKDGHYQENLDGINIYKIMIIGESENGVVISLINEPAIRFVNLNFSNLTFTGEQGIVLNGNGGSSQCTFNRCTFENFTSYSGPVKYIIDSKLGFLYISDCAFINSNNICPIHYENYQTNIIKNSIIDNIFLDNEKSYKGLIYNDRYSNVDMYNLTISNCNIAAIGLLNSQQTANITNSNFINNTVNGGSLIASNSLNLESSAIMDNKVSDYLIYSSNGIPILNYNLIKNNQCNSGLNNSEINLDYNLWGKEDKPSNVKKWIILDACYDGGDLIYGDEINITVFFKYKTSDGETGDIPKPLPDGIEVKINSSSSENIFKGFTKNGKAIIRYASNINDKEVSIAVFDEKITLPIVLSTVKIELGQINIGENLLVKVSACGESDIVVLIIDGKKETIRLTDGQAQKTINNLSFGNHVIKAYYPNENGVLAIKEFNVNKLETSFHVENITIFAGEIADLVIISENNLSGEFIANINGNKYYSTVKDGINHIYIDNLNMGNYSVTITYPGNYKYLTANNHSSITVKGLNAELVVQTLTSFVDDVKISINLNEDINGTVDVIIDEMNYPTVIKNGYGIINITSLANGSYIAFIKFNGNQKYLPNQTNITINVSKKDISNNLEYTIDFIKQTTKITFKVNLANATGQLTISVDGMQNYSSDIINGKFEITTEELKCGIHNILFNYSGNNKYYSFISENKQIIVPKITLDGDCIVVDQFTYSFNAPYDANGTLSISVDGVPYATETVDGGMGTVSIGNLAPGNYKVSIVYSGNDRYESIVKNISLDIPKPHVPVIKITGNDVSMSYASGAKYQVRLTSDGQPIVGKTVTFNINGKIIPALSDKNGFASVNIDLAPKSTKYSVYASYNDLTVFNKIKVTSIVQAKDLKIKKSAKSTKIKISLKKVNGKYLKSKQMTIKFNGKTYMVKTNKKGVATWKVKKSVLKKLKVGKKYKYAVTYGKDKVTKKLTIKK